MQRSSQWPIVRLAKLQKQQWRCQACPEKYNRQARRSVEVHHILSVFKRPDLELQPENLIVLCPGCHDSLHFVLRSPVLCMLFRLATAPNAEQALRIEFGPTPNQFPLDLPAANDPVMYEQSRG